MALVRATVVNGNVAIYTAKGLIQTKELPIDLILMDGQESFIFLEIFEKKNGLVICGLMDSYNNEPYFEGLFNENQLAGDYELIERALHHFEKESKRRYKEWIMAKLTSDLELINKHIKRVKSL